MKLATISVLVVISLAAACGESDEEPAAGSGGTSGSASGGSGGTSGSGGTGASGTGSGGAGSGGTGSGGTAGSAGTMSGSGGMGGGGGETITGGEGGSGPFPDGHLGRDPDLSVDLTLGGFNQDLPEPIGDCELSEDMPPQCMKISGLYNDVPFDLQTICPAAFVYLGGGYRAHGCNFDMGGGDMLYIGSRIGTMTAPTAPSVFELQGPLGGDVDLALERASRKLDSHEDVLVPIITETHDTELRAAGELWFYQSWEDSPRYEVVGLSFALSITPKPDCKPDSEGFGCDTIRLRGELHGQTLRALEAP